MIKTKAGLPNTCSQCGTPCEEWYAENEEQATAGQGLCARCAGQEKPKAKPKRKPVKEVTKND